MTGTYQWDATYSGDTNNNTVSDNGAGNEQVTVGRGQPDDQHRAQPHDGHAKKNRLNKNAILRHGAGERSPSARPVRRSPLPPAPRRSRWA